MKRDARVYLEKVNLAAGEIADFIAGTDFDGYLTNSLLQSAVERNLTVVGAALASLKEIFPELAERIPNAQRAMDLRNHLICEYYKIDQSAVWDTVMRQLPELRQTAQSVLAELDCEATASDPRLIYSHKD